MSAVVKQMWAVQQLFRQSVPVWAAVCCSWTSAGSVTQTTTRFTVDQGEINKTKKMLMVLTALAQFMLNQKRDRHAKYVSYRVKPNPEQLFRSGVRVEKHKPFSLAWRGFQFEHGFQDMLADHVGLTSIKCFWGVRKNVMHQVFIL